MNIYIYIYKSFFSILDLPNEKGRFEILKYITNNLKKNARLASDVTEKELYAIAMNTINYSGADLVELSYHASLMAMKRIGKVILELKKLMILYVLLFIIRI